MKRKQYIAFIVLLCLLGLLWFVRESSAGFVAGGTIFCFNSTGYCYNITNDINLTAIYATSYNITFEGLIDSNDTIIDLTHSTVLYLDCNNCTLDAPTENTSLLFTTIVPNYVVYAPNPYIETEKINITLEVVNLSYYNDINAVITWNGNQYNPKSKTKNPTNYSFLFQIQTPLNLETAYYNFTINITTDAGIETYTTPTYNHSAVIFKVSYCQNNTNTTAIVFGVYNEETLEPITGASIGGLITYWYSSKSYAKNFTFSFNNTANVYFGSDTDTLTNPNVDYANSVVTTLFTVKKTSIITKVTGLTNTPDSTTINVSIRKGSCSGSVLASKSYTTPGGGSDLYTVTFGISDYSEILKPAETYCLEVRDVGGLSPPTYSTGYSYSGSIITIQNQNMIAEYSETVLTIQEVLQSAEKLCIYPSNVTLHADAYIQYSVQNGYTHRYYLINASLTNETTSLYLYNFNTTTTTETLQLNVVDENYNKYPNVYVKMLRYYPSEGLWRLVQMDKADDFGKTFFHVKEEDTDYKFIFQDYMTVLKTTNPLKFNCPTADDCVITVIVESISSISESLFKDFTYSYDNNTKIFTLTWNDPTGLTKEITLEAYSDTASGRVIWCSKTLASASGTLTCNLTKASGTVFVTAYRSASPKERFFLYKIEEVFKLFYDKLKESNLHKQGVIYAGMVSAVMILAGAFSPLGVVIAAPVSLAILKIMGILNFITTTFVILASIVGLVIGLLVREK